MIKIKKEAPMPGSSLLGRSKWWGNPDLPPTADYPVAIDGEGEEHTLTFVCQINLADIAHADTPLPKEGLLLFFANIDYFLGDTSSWCSGEYIWGADETRVVYVRPDDMASLVENVLVDESNNPIALPPRPLTFVESSEDDDLDEPYDRLLCQPYLMPWDDWDAPCQGWNVLLQVSSDEADDYALQFFDEGFFYFLIDPADLEQGRFDNVRGTVVGM